MKGKNWWKQPISWVLVLLAIIGLIFIFVSFLFEDDFKWLYIVSHIGIALIISCILGLTIDRILRQGIVEDSFKASIGYLLPEELKPEMEWVYQQTMIATSHIMNCRITRLNNELVNLNIEVNRKIENVTQSLIQQPIGLGIDEWFHKEKQSQIMELGYQKEDQAPVNIDVTNVKHGKYDLSVDGGEITIAPKQKVDVWIKYEEIKHVNDETHVNFRVATRNPFVNIEICEGLDYVVAFGHREQKFLKRLGENKYQIEGTLLPGQPINIRWWLKDASKDWQTER